MELPYKDCAVNSLFIFGRIERGTSNGLLKGEDEFWYVNMCKDRLQNVVAHFSTVQYSMPLSTSPSSMKNFPMDLSLMDLHRSFTDAARVKSFCLSCLSTIFWVTAPDETIFGGTATDDENSFICSIVT